MNTFPPHSYNMNFNTLTHTVHTHTRKYTHTLTRTLTAGRGLVVGFSAAGKSMWENVLPIPQTKLQFTPRCDSPPSLVFL